MRSLPLKRIFSHYAPYFEHVTKQPILDNEVKVGDYVDILATLAEDPPDKQYIAIDFCVHPHIDTYSQKSKQRFKTGINWKTIEDNLVQRLEKLFLEEGTNQQLHIGIEGETDTGMLVCVALVKDPNKKDIDSLHSCITRRMQEDGSLSFKCHDPNNKVYLTMQVEGFSLSTFRGGNWSLPQWDTVAQVIGHNW